jgi:hypothetical protein
MDPITGDIYNLKYLPPPNDQPCIANRLTQRKSDLDSERIQRRLEFYHSSIGQILSCFQNVDRIDSTKHVNDVFAEIDKVIENKHHSSDFRQKSAGKCVICMLKPADHLVIPCGHQCGCVGCLSAEKNESGQCPICHIPIVSLIQVK